MRVSFVLMLLTTLTPLLLTPLLAGAAEKSASPWGAAEVLAIDYQPQKVLFDIDTGSETKLSNVLDRVSLLNNLYGADPFAARIVVVLHGDSIPLFATANHAEHETLMIRAHSLTLGDTIEFRMCQAAARHYFGLEAKDVHGFVKMVPMADAEIIRLQAEEGFAYMR